MRTQEQIKQYKKEYNKRIYLENKEKIKNRVRTYQNETGYKEKYRSENKEKIKECNNKYQERNKEKVKNLSKEYRSKHKEEIREKIKEYRVGHKEQIKETSKKYHKVWYEENKEKIIKKSSKYYIENCDYIKEKYKKIRLNDREQVNEKYNNYIRKRMSEDHIFKLTRNIRTLIYRAFKDKGFNKNERTEEILGCSFKEFQEHIKNQLEDWMTFENYGKYNGKYKSGWDIDHIIELKTAETEEDILKLNHYTNLRPLDSKINRGDRNRRYS